MKLTTEIIHSIEKLDINEYQKSGLYKLVSEILKHIPGPVEQKEEWRAGMIVHWGEIDFYALLMERGRFIWLHGCRPEFSAMKWPEIMKDYSIAYSNLSEYLKDHPKSVEFLRELLRLEREAQ